MEEQVVSCWWLWRFAYLNDNKKIRSTCVTTSHVSSMIFKQQSPKQALTQRHVSGKKTKVTTVVLKMWYMYFSPGPEKKDWALNWRFAGSNPILPAMYDQAPNVIWVKISCVQCMCMYNDSYRWCFDALWWLPEHLAFYLEKMCLVITVLNTPTSSVRWFTLSRGLRGLLPPVGH